MLSMAVSFTACDKYLDVKPKGLVIPEKLGDYEGLLNAPTDGANIPDQPTRFHG